MALVGGADGADKYFKLLIKITGVYCDFLQLSTKRRCVLSLIYDFSETNLERETHGKQTVKNQFRKV